MPTYKNNTETQINYEAGGKIYNFLPGRETSTTIFVPYKELGLELIDENYPPLKSKILISGTFKFRVGMERRINIPHCEKYRLKVKVKSGLLKLYQGNSGLSMTISDDYDTEQEWGYAPYVKFIGAAEQTEAIIYGETVSP